ncbi:MAG TPA: KamA family radical SAM protein [Parachlamydiaceae bacterium]|nr:KamA family radical SAM protein [Parachlamydiaceae bacterium]
MLIELGSPPLWKKILRTNFTDPSKLADFLELDELQRQKILFNSKFKLSLPQRLANKITKNTLDDPILRQFLPTMEEKNISPGFLLDPVGDSKCRIDRKLLHKYEGRVLLVCTSACAMHCRYCFRQNFDYAITEKLFVNEMKIIADDTSINEVILSGGDPLSLDNRTLNELLNGLAAIPHIKKVRFHTRFPIGIPERLDQSFLDMLEGLPLQFWFVIHANHPNELDADIFLALKSLQKVGIPVLNQFVLLRGINDSVEVLTELCSLLADHGIMGYYMHQLDRVQGAAHFEVSEDEGLALVDQLAKKLPGYAVPKYVKEISGMSSKTPITS